MPRYSLPYHLNASPVLSIHFFADTILFGVTPLLSFQTVIRKPPLRLCCSAHFQSLSRLCISSSLPCHSPAVPLTALAANAFHFIPSNASSFLFIAVPLQLSPLPMQINSRLCLGSSCLFIALPLHGMSHLCLCISHLAISSLCRSNLFLALLHHSISFQQIIYFCIIARYFLPCKSAFTRISPLTKTVKFPIVQAFTHDRQQAVIQNFYSRFYKASCRDSFTHHQRYTLSLRR